MLNIPGSKGFHHPVEIIDLVVDDEKADTKVPQSRSNIDIGRGGLEVARWMVMDNDIPMGTGVEDGRNRFFGATGQYLNLDDAQLRIGLAEKKHLTATGLRNGVAYLIKAIW
jgi:hypothetical protein